jgi:hypothetical protein
MRIYRRNHGSLCISSGSDSGDGNYADSIFASSPLDPDSLNRLYRLAGEKERVPAKTWAGKANFWE